MKQPELPDIGDKMDVANLSETASSGYVAPTTAPIEGQCKKVCVFGNK